MAFFTCEDKIVDIMSDSLYNTRTLNEQIVRLLESMYMDRRGNLYKVIVETVERPLIEYVLAQTGGNQLKAACILGINRNTMRARIKKLSIDINRWKNS